MRVQLTDAVRHLIETFAPFEGQGLNWSLRRADGREIEEGVVVPVSVSVFAGDGFDISFDLMLMADDIIGLWREAVMWGQSMQAVQRALCEHVSDQPYR